MQCGMRSWRCFVPSRTRFHTDQGTQFSPPSQATAVASYNTRFYDSKNKTYRPTFEPTQWATAPLSLQTALALPLALGIVPAADVAQVTAHLAALVQAADWHLTTGDDILSVLALCFLLHAVPAFSPCYRLGRMQVFAAYARGWWVCH